MRRPAPPQQTNSELHPVGEGLQTFTFPERHFIMRNLFVMAALVLGTLLMSGCLNSEYHEESGLLFISRSTLFEPSATVVLMKATGEPVPFAAGGSGFEQVTSLGAPIGAAAVRRPNRTGVSVSGTSGAAAGALGVGIGIGEGGDGGNGGGGGDGGAGGAGGHPHGGPPGLDPEGPPGHQDD